MEKYADIKRITYCAEGSYPDKFQEPGYITKEYEIICVSEGSIYVTINEKVFLLKEGDLSLVPPGNFFSARGKAKAEVLVSGFDMETDCERLKKPSVFTLNNFLKEQIGKMLYLSGVNEDKAKALLRIYLELVLTVLSDFNSKTESFDTVSASAETFSEIFRFMCNNVSRKISLEEMADEIGLGLSNLKKIIFVHGGTGVTGLFNIIKIMEFEKNGVTDLGFINKQYFSRLYFKHTGKRIKRSRL